VLSADIVLYLFI